MILFYLLPNWMANPKKIAKKRIPLPVDKEILSTHSNEEIQNKTRLLPAPNSFLFTPSPGSFEI